MSQPSQDLDREHLRRMFGRYTEEELGTLIEVLTELREAKTSSASSSLKLASYGAVP